MRLRLKMGDVTLKPITGYEQTKSLSRGDVDGYTTDCVTPKCSSATYRDKPRA